MCFPHSQYLQDLINKKSNIIIADIYDEQALMVLCEAYKLKVSRFVCCDDPKMAFTFFFVKSDDRGEWLRVVSAGVAAEGLVASFVVEECQLQFG